MDELKLDGSEQQTYQGSVIRDGKIFAQNSGVCVEERYPTAYNLGSGRARWDGWINVDGTAEADIQADIRSLPMIPTDSADAVAAIHVLEHFYEWEAEPLLTEWKRILKPGGKMILELPSMDKVFRYIAWAVTTGADLQAFMSLHAMWGDPVYRSPAMCHKWGWFQKPLVALLEKIGMREIRLCDARYHFRFRDQRIECVK